MSAYPSSELLYVQDWDLRPDSTTPRLVLSWVGPLIRDADRLHYVTRASCTHLPGLSLAALTLPG